MTVSVGEAHREIAKSTACRHLPRGVDGVGLIFQTRDGTEPHERTVGVRIVAAGDAKIGKRLARDGCPISKRGHWIGDAVAIGLGNRLAGGEWICGGRHGEKLVQVTLVRQVCPLAANIGDGSYEVTW